MVVHTQILSRLGLLELQAVGQTCRATRAISASLTDSRLRQLLEV